MNDHPIKLFTAPLHKHETVDLRSTNFRLAYPNQGTTPVDCENAKTDLIAAVAATKINRMIADRRFETAARQILGQISAGGYPIEIDEILSAGDLDKVLMQALFSLDNISEQIRGL